MLPVNSRPRFLPIDSQAIHQLLELIAVLVVGRMEMLGLGEELQGVVPLQAVPGRGPPRTARDRGRRRRAACARRTALPSVRSGFKAARPVQPSWSRRDS